MNFKTTTSLVGFLLALSTLNSPSAAEVIGEVEKSEPKPTIEGRLNRLSAAIRAREEQLPESHKNHDNFTVAGGWADGRGREWVNGRRAGWADGHNGGFANVKPWRNAWADGGSFYNSNPWRNGVGWVNASGGGGFVNRR